MLNKIFLAFIMASVLSACSMGDDNDKKKKKSTATENTQDTLKKSNPCVTFEQKVIYGEDNRLDYCMVSDSGLLWASQATAILLKPNALTEENSEQWKLNDKTFGESFNLCEDERFREQPNPGFCSGFLVAPHLLVTAGHCIQSQRDCEKTQFAFDFKYSSTTSNPTIISKKNVYSCKKLHYSIAYSKGEDFAIVELHRPVDDRTPMSLRTEGDVSPGDELVVMGHPAGLPLKIASGAHVRRLANNFFVADLDTYGGNSGSAVLSPITLQVEGILVRGEVDFVWSGQCRKSNICPQNGCSGEDVTNIKVVVDKIKELGL